MPKKEKIDFLRLKIGRKAENFAFNFLSERYRVEKGKKREMYFKDFTLAGRVDYTIFGDAVEAVEVKHSKLKKPKPEWFAQLNIYLLLEGLKRGMLLEVGEEIRVTRTRFSPKLMRESLKYYSELKDFIENREIPKGEGTYCNFCGYRYLCNQVPRVFRSILL
jgi:CRISPR/Cas system-associated exonuclease Cas4 (RecB family)